MNNTLMFISGIGVQELLIIGLVVLVFFGAKKLPDFMKGLGKGVREFKDEMKEIKSTVDTEAKKVEQP